MRDREVKYGGEGMAGRKENMITIRRAVYDDIPDIMRFMDEHWKPGNILAKNREFFEWQFLDGEKLNMFIGVDEECGKIYGMMGAIVYNKSNHPDISGCTWQVIKSRNPMLGLDIQNYLYKQLNARYSCAAGLSDKSVRINKIWGEMIVSMDHYYRLADCEDYKIAKIKRKLIPEVKESGYSLKLLKSVEEMKQVISEETLARQVLSKDYSYIEKRYFKHPVYQYEMWMITDEKRTPRSVLVTREESVYDRKICKIVDYYGEFNYFKHITDGIDKLIRQRRYEYVDVYSYGVPTDLYEKAGFVRCDEYSENIIPNYFHPFVQKNISLKMIQYDVPGLRLFRGDGDQDRPC